MIGGMDQTATVFGLSGAEIHAFAEQTAGRGLDRFNAELGKPSLLTGFGTDTIMEVLTKSVYIDPAFDAMSGPTSMTRFGGLP